VGLDLCIVKRLSQIIGVQIQIKSRVDRGTSVTIQGFEEVATPIQ
jgi:hypothetical protein